MAVAVAGGLLFSRAVLSICSASGFLLVLLLPGIRNNSKKSLRIVLLFVITIVVFYGYIFLIVDRSLVGERLIFYLSAVGIIGLAFFITAPSRLAILLIILLGLASCVPTVVDMLFQKGLTDNYEKGQVAKTLMDGDHQRFSIWISGCLALAWFSFFKTRKTWLSICITLLSLFLAVLAVRTGWLFLIIINVVAVLNIYIARIPFRKISWLIITMLLLATALAIVPFAAKKMNYVKWEWVQQDEADKYAGSDATRRMVNQEALVLVRQNPIGMGLLKGPGHLKQLVKDKYPQTVNAYGWPFNQYLYWWLVAGWGAGSLPLLLMLVGLGWLIVGKKIITAAWFFFIMLTCLYESTLEMQYGMFLAVFFTAILYNQESGRHKSPAG